MPRANQYQWQAPGNGRLFDTSLEEWETSLMSQRCIGVLKIGSGKTIKHIEIDYDGQVKEFEW